MKRLCVFCGSSAGADPLFAEQAFRLGKEMAIRRMGLVFGGGHIGLMGVLADAILGAGGEAHGVIPQTLVDKELAHPGLTCLHVVSTMHERKAMMVDLADAFLALPGGFGTADELFEVLTWSQLGIHGKPIGLLNVMGFFDPLLAWLDRALAEGFLRAHHRGLLVEGNVPGDLLDALWRLTGKQRASP